MYTRTENEVSDMWRASSGGVSDCLLRFFLIPPFFKIRISLVHNIAIYIKFCPVPWSLFAQGHFSLTTGSVLCWVGKQRTGEFLVTANPVMINMWDVCAMWLTYNCHMI